MAVVYRAEDGFCLNKYLLEKGFAWLTDEKGSLLEERDLALLTGIPEEKRSVSK